MTHTIVGQYNTGIVTIDGKLLSPVPSQKVYNHSPDGFMWGYSGSGPAQLALAIMLAYTTEEIAVEIYQDFKDEVIATIPQKDFEIKLDIERWIKGKRFA